MAITFSADEVFEIAEHIEKKAANFYQKVAQGTRDKETKKMFQEFSTMEGGHAKTFADMREGISRVDSTPMVYDPEGEVVLYLKSFAEAHGWEGMADKEDEFTGQETAEQILESALRAEKDSVAFYVGIKNMVASTTTLRG